MSSQVMRRTSAAENNYPHLLKTRIQSQQRDLSGADELDEQKRSVVRDYCADLPLISAVGELAVPGSRPPDTAKASTPKRTTSPQAPGGTPR
jgi:hypothetical protein